MVEASAEEPVVDAWVPPVWVPPVWVPPVWVPVLDPPQVLAGIVHLLSQCMVGVNFFAPQSRPALGARMVFSEPVPQYLQQDSSINSDRQFL